MPVAPVDQPEARNRLYFIYSGWLAGSDLPVRALSADFIGRRPKSETIAAEDRKTQRPRNPGRLEAGSSLWIIRAHDDIGTG